MRDDLAREEPQAAAIQGRTLADLKPGESGVVASVGGADALHRHLLDMGLTPGVTVRLQKTAPMGDPLELHLRGYALTLRLEDARKIRLR
jgi:Fe2+ transport system protein FeoA